MAEGNVVFTRRDWLQEPDATIGGGVWRQPIANVLDDRPQFVAEAVDNRDSGSTTFDIDLGRVRRGGLISFDNLRASRLAILKVYAGTDPTFATNTYEVVTSAWPQDCDGFSYDAWGQYTLSGVYQGNEYVKLGMTRYLIPDAVFDCRYVRVRLRDRCAVDPLQIGCVGVWEIWQPPQNLTFGWQLSVVDESSVDRVPEGTTYVTERGTRRRLNLGFGLQTRDEVWARGFGVALISGRSKPLIVVPFPERPTELEKQAVRGRLSNDSPLSNPLVGRYSQLFQLDQDI